MPARLVFVLVAAAGVLVLGCGGGDAPSGPGSGGSGGQGGAGAAGGGAGGSVPVACRAADAEPKAEDGAPVAFWASQPLRPDETAVVTAGNIDVGATVEVALVPDCDPGSPLDATNYALHYDKVAPIYASKSGTQFVIPKSYQEGVFAFRLTSGGKTGARKLINAPDLWFVQGDVGAFATPGGWLQVHGTSLGSGKSTEAALVKGGKVVATLHADAGDADNDGYRERLAIPASVPEGDYELWLHNGHGGALGWTRFSTFIEAPIDHVTIRKRRAWPAKVVDVSKQPGGDDDARFDAAIAALKDGGVLSVPAGTYALTRSLVLPHRTLLRGAGKDETKLTWSAQLPTALVRGVILTSPTDRATFSIEDIAIVGSAGADPDGTPGHNGVELVYASEPAWIRRTNVVMPSVGAGNQEIDAVFLEKCSSIEITDSELDARRSLFAREEVEYLRAENDVLDYRDISVWYSAKDHGFIFAHNRSNIRGNASTNGWVPGGNPGFAFTAFHVFQTVNGPYTRDLYFGHNKGSTDEDLSQDPLVASVGYTSDGASGIFEDHFTAAGTTLTLAVPTRDPGVNASNGMPFTYDYVGGIAMIVEGAGVGQWRYLVHAPDRSTTVEIDRPFDVAPDPTSILNLLNLQGRSLFVGNDFNVEWVNQEFASALDIIRADNTFTVGASWNFVGNPYPWSTYVTPWHFQVLDNQVPSNQDFVTITAFSTDSYKGRAASAIVYRNNVYPSASPDSSIGFYTKGQVYADSLMEKNKVGGIYLGQGDDVLAYSGMVMRKNDASYQTGLLNGKNLPDLAQQGVYYLP